MNDRDEWRAARDAMTEAELAQITPYYRRPPGQVGEPDDDTPDFDDRSEEER